MELNEVKELIEETLEVSLLKKTRKRDVTDARFIYFNLCRKYLLRTYESIGDSLNMNHASVVNGVKKFNGIIESDNDFKMKWMKCKELLLKALDKENGNEESVESIELKHQIEMEKLKNKYEKTSEVVKLFEKIPKEYSLEFIDTRLKPFLSMCEGRLYQKEIEVVRGAKIR